MVEIETVAPETLKQELQVPAYVTRFSQGRHETGHSSLSLGKLIGVSPQAVLQFEAGKQQLKLDTFVAACDALHLNVRWVLKGLGEMFEGEPPARRKARRAKRIK